MMTTAVIGDIHGELGRLNSMLDDYRLAGRHLVFLGDYVNRGLDSRRVIQRLIDLRSDDAERVTFLVGNHDQALLDVLRGGSAVPLLKIGGASTVLSWVSDVVGDVGLALRNAVSQDERDFLERLVDSWSSGNYVATHAICPGSIERLGPEQILIVGHHIQRDAMPRTVKQCVFLDTGCGSMPHGRLSAFLLPERIFVSH